MNNAALNEILDRLANLERENRRLRSLVKAAVLLSPMVLGPSLYFGCQSRSGTIAAREIALADPQGHVRAKLSVSRAEGSTEFLPSLQFLTLKASPPCPCPNRDYIPNTKEAIRHLVSPVSNSAGVMHTLFAERYASSLQSRRERVHGLTTCRSTEGFQLPPA